MKAKSSAHYQREYRKRLREAGLTKKEVWIHPSNSKLLSYVEKKLRENLNTGPDKFQMMTTELTNGDKNMTNTHQTWTTDRLYNELKTIPPFSSGQATLELINGVEPALYIAMHEYGDLPIFVTVSGEQIIAESVLWSTEEVTDINKLNDAILRSHKFFPLSTISLDHIESGQDYYHMFGALSAASELSNIVLEIEVLASNVIQATEAYSEFLTNTHSMQA